MLLLRMSTVRFSTRDESLNLGRLAPLALGEAACCQLCLGRNPDPLHTESTTAVRGGSKTIGGRPLPLTSKRPVACA